MLQKLQQRWKVNSVNLIFILFTFALGGSLCGITARKILGLFSISGPVWLIAYLLLVTLLWPFCVLLISIPFGQLSFFKKYLTHMMSTISGKKTSTPLIAIFASGAGSNAQKIIDHFSSNPAAGSITLIVANKPGAGVLAIAKHHGIATLLIEKSIFFNSDDYIAELKRKGIDFIVLAGFLWKVPANLIKAYPNSIVNIHPALLPNYGGKGMYGQHVHEAVIAAGDAESGITIHYVDEQYDHGNIIFQATCKLEAGETADSLAKKIHILEHQHYPAVIAAVLQNAKSALKP